MDKVTAREFVLVDGTGRTIGTWGPGQLVLHGSDSAVARIVATHERSLLEIKADRGPSVLLMATEQGSGATFVGDARGDQFSVASLAASEEMAGLSMCWNDEWKGTWVVSEEGARLEQDLFDDFDKEGDPRTSIFLDARTGRPTITGQARDGTEVFALPSGKDE